MNDVWIVVCVFDERDNRQPLPALFTHRSRAHAPRPRPPGDECMCFYFSVWLPVRTDPRWWPADLQPGVTAGQRSQLPASYSYE